MHEKTIRIDRSAIVMSNGNSLITGSDLKTPENMYKTSKTTEIDRLV
jgi:hypothetical protein